MGHESFKPRRFCPPRFERFPGRGSVMSGCVLGCESAAGLTAERLKRRGISYIPNSYEPDGAAYRNHLRQSASSGEFCRRMADLQNRLYHRRTAGYPDHSRVRRPERLPPKGLCGGIGLWGTGAGGDTVPTEKAERDRRPRGVRVVCHGDQRENSRMEGRLYAQFYETGDHGLVSSPSG